MARCSSSRVDCCGAAWRIMVGRGRRLGAWLARACAGARRRERAKRQGSARVGERATRNSGDSARRARARRGPRRLPRLLGRRARRCSCGSSARRCWLPGVGGERQVGRRAGLRASGGSRSGARGTRRQGASEPRKVRARRRASWRRAGLRCRECALEHVGDADGARGRRGRRAVLAAARARREQFERATWMVAARERRLRRRRRGRRGRRRARHGAAAAAAESAAAAAEAAAAGGRAGRQTLGAAAHRGSKSILSERD